MPEEISNPGVLHRGAKRALHFFLDAPVTSARLIWHFHPRLAEQFLWRVHVAEPYNLALGECLCDMLYEAHEKEYPFGTVERGRFLLSVLGKSYPSPSVTEAYFANLRAVLQKREPLESPGELVLGLGSGRCGSTTLAAILHSAPRAVGTHEIPPWIFWPPFPQQVSFHLARFRLYTAYHPLVSDVAIWWVHLVDQLFEEFPTAKAIGLCRDVEATVASFMAQDEDNNHWVAPYNGIWLPAVFDTIFPKYEVPENARKDRRAAKETLVRRYVTEYQSRLLALKEQHGERFLIIHSEELDAPEARERISTFVGAAVTKEPIRRNSRVHDDTASSDHWYF